MVEQRRKDPGRKGRPADRGGKTRRARPSAGRSRGAALGRGRGQREAARPQRRRTSRSRAPRTDEHGRRVVRPSTRWRPMRRVGEASPVQEPAMQEAPLVHGGPQGSLEQPSPSEQTSVGAQQQTEQTPPRHGRLGRLFRRHG